MCDEYVVISTHNSAANKLSPICVIVQPFLASLAPTNEGRESGVSLVDFGNIKNKSEPLMIMHFRCSYYCVHMINFSLVDWCSLIVPGKATVSGLRPLVDTTAL